MLNTAKTKYWGQGNSSSSDGQRFKTGDRSTKAGSINPKYGNDPGVILLFSYI